MGVGAIELELPKDVGYNGKLYYEGGVEAKEPIDKSKKIFFKTAKGNFYEVTNKDAAIDKNGKAISTAGKNVGVDDDMVQRNGLFDLYDKGLDEEKGWTATATSAMELGQSAG